MDGSVADTIIGRNKELREGRPGLSAVHGYLMGIILASWSGDL